jgi:hypothetical protein
VVAARGGIAHDQHAVRAQVDRGRGDDAALAETTISVRVPWATAAATEVVPKCTPRL